MFLIFFQQYQLVQFSQRFKVFPKVFSHRVYQSSKSLVFSIDKLSIFVPFFKIMIKNGGYAIFSKKRKW